MRSRKSFDSYLYLYINIKITLKNLTKKRTKYDINHKFIPPRRFVLENDKENKTLESSISSIF